MRRRLPLMLLLAASAVGCGGDGREDAVQAAEQWLSAVAERDADAACELMHESAVDAIRKKSGLDDKSTCLGTVRDYSDAFRPGNVDGILKIGLEAEGPVKKNEVGVFPRSGPRQLQVILMRRGDGEWKVGGLTLGPTEPGREATPTATPASD